VNVEREDTMQQDRSLPSHMTRRTLMAGAAVGTFALAGGPAAAQRCPATPPARAKGPLVWMDMDQQDLDEAYDNDVYAFNAKNVLERQGKNNEIALSVIGKPMRVALSA